jgi:hypothetical protein
MLDGGYDGAFVTHIDRNCISNVNGLAVVVAHVHTTSI